MNCWQFIDQERSGYPIIELRCRTPDVSAAHYYTWRKHRQYRQVVGWRVLNIMPKLLVISILGQALLARRPAPGLAVHSDRGGQYCANAYRTLLDQQQCRRSQSRRDECLNNVQAESLWSRLKTGELGPREWPVFRDLADAPHSLATYFDCYNYERRHQALAYQTSRDFCFQQLKNAVLNSLA